MTGQTARARAARWWGEREGAGAVWAEAADPEARLAELARSRGALRRVLAGLANALVARRPRPHPGSGAGSQPSPAASQPKLGTTSQPNLAAIPGWERLGYVRAGDYARERLGLSARSLYDLARVGRALDGLPRLEAALVSGALPWSKVRLLARVAEPADEPHWIELARRLGVRALEKQVRRVDRGALGAAAPPALEAPDCDEDGASTEPTETARLRIDSALAFKWRRTRTWAARVAGERVSPGTVLEMITAETLSALPLHHAARGDFTATAPSNVCTAHGNAAAANVCADHGDAAVANVCTAHGDAAAANVCTAHGDAAVANVCTAHGNAAAANVCTAHGDQAVANVCAGHASLEAGLAAHDPAPQLPHAERCPLPHFLAPLLDGLDEADAFELDARLRRAVRLEQCLDAQIAPLLRRVASSEHVWRGAHRTVAAFVRERLGMSPRKARALLRLERVSDVCPTLRAAFRDGSLSWVQAQILAPLLFADAEGPWRAAWVGFARQVTVRRLDEAVGQALALREAASPLWHECRDAPERAFELETRAQARAFKDRQTCARPMGLLQGIQLRIVASRDVVRLFRATLCTLRKAIEAETGRLPSEAEAFDAMIDHALRSWGVDDPWLRARARRPRRVSVFERDGWRCTVPGCTSQRNLHAHHIHFRSAGGSNETSNLTTLCAAHHHRGVHAGRVRVGGQAPDALWFELGVRDGRPPLARFRSGDRVA